MFCSSTARGLVAALFSAGFLLSACADSEPRATVTEVETETVKVKKTVTEGPAPAATGGAAPTPAPAPQRPEEIDPGPGDGPDLPPGAYDSFEEFCADQPEEPEC
jgi:hypothetical protein